MSPLTRTDLLSLEQYAEQRNEFRARVMEHKKSRRVAIGEHATLYFEDALTMQYQVQEMLRIERIFEVDAIQDELEVYNPLIPAGESLFLRKFVLGIKAQANSKTSRDRLCLRRPTVLRTLRNHLFAALHNSLSDSTPT
ncbi:DUF3501 family protein [Candidatus Reidiella endopervernicosa]|uniref:DUF3501 family protein n=1 Tax=Candidatus Reidiella endopervernicosa TaxID=2738883 RepID=A0A6N0HS43_9GAMM|nr:DUF3501 family protein [Candidatus Reidiella endopervernicosa]